MAQAGSGIGPPSATTRPNGLSIVAADALDVALVDASGAAVAAPALPRMVLGPFTFVVNPSGLAWTEPPIFAVHKPPGGTPRYQLMGRDETKLTLRGKLSGDAALADLAGLRALNGTRQPFSYGAISAAQAWVRVDVPAWNRDDDVDYAIALAIEAKAPTTAATGRAATQPAQAAGQAATMQAAAQQSPTVSYTVVTGDTLWSIAQAKLGDGSLFPVIARLNSIDDPNTIAPGQVLQLPSDAAAARATKAQQDAQLAALPNDNGTGLAQTLLGAP